MPAPLPRPEVPAESVRTPSDGLLVVSLCPVCRRAELRGRQTVCSAACRRRRSRQRSEEARQAQIQDVKSLLHAALTKLENAR
jgi:hypothetical protein